MTLTTTFTLLGLAGACRLRYRHLARELGGIRAYGKYTPIPLAKILAVNGCDDATWALRATKPEQRSQRDKIARLFACWCARNTPLPDGRTVWDLLVDERSRRGVEAAEQCTTSLSPFSPAMAGALDAYNDISIDSKFPAFANFAADSAYLATVSAANEVCNVWYAARAASSAAASATGDAVRITTKNSGADSETVFRASCVAQDAAKLAAKHAQGSELARMLREDR